MSAFDNVDMPGNQREQLNDFATFQPRQDDNRKADAQRINRVKETARRARFLISELVSVSGLSQDDADRLEKRIDKCVDGWLSDICNDHLFLKQ